MSKHKRKIKSSLIEKLRKIKVVLTDVDGVLTDGGMFYTSDGLVMKKFFVKDGMGSVRLKKAGFKVGLLSSDKSEINKVRGERLQFDFVFYGIDDKKVLLNEICEQNNFKLENVAYIGDDTNDLGILKSVGFSSAPNDAISEVTSIVDYVCKHKGGKGAFREFAELIIKSNQN